MRNVVAVAACAALASWFAQEVVAQTDLLAPEELRMLTNEEIHRLIDGSELTGGTFPPPGAHANIERYCAGQFAFIGTLGPVSGTYVIENNRLCLSYSGLGNDNLCALYFQDQNGQYFRQRIIPSDLQPTPIEVRATSCE